MEESKENITPTRFVSSTTAQDHHVAEELQERKTE
jgi:hypothetical protein